MRYPLVLVLSSFIVAAASAQQPTRGRATPPKNPSKPATADANDQSARLVTIVGCLQTTGVADTFSLTSIATPEVTPSPAAKKDGDKTASTGSSAGTTSGTSIPQAGAATLGTAGSVMTFLIVSDGKMDLQQHVGRRVEVTGTIVPLTPTEDEDDPDEDAPARSDAPRDPNDVQVATGLSPVVTRPGTGGSGNPLGTPPTSGAAAQGGGTGANTAAGTAPQPIGSVTVDPSRTATTADTAIAGTTAGGPVQRLVVRSVRMATGACQ